MQQYSQNTGAHSLICKYVSGRLGFHFSSSLIWEVAFSLNDTIYLLKTPQFLNA